MNLSVPLARLLVVLSLVGLNLEVRAEEKSIEEAKTFAQKLLDEGAKEYARKDKRVMARWYTEDAEAKFVSKEESGAIKVESYRGRAEIEDWYGKVFEGDAKLSPKNTVETARYLSDEMIVISGVFKPDEAGEIAVQFVQIRQKVDKAWLIRDMQVFFLPKN